jgi:hypothetical protein
MKIRNIYAFLTLLAALLFGGLAYGQGVTSSSIAGQVVDDKGAPVAGATVKAIHTPSGSLYGAVTNEKGRFLLQGLRVGGPYDVTASSDGYKDFKQSGLFLELGDVADVNPKLIENAAQLEAVVVSAEADPVLNSGRTGAQTSIANTKITQLPTITRSVADYTRLTPQAGAGGSFGGVSGNFNNFTLNGAIFNNAFGLSNTVGGQASAQPISLDAIDQITVNIAPYDVRQGSFTGAGINAVTKSGTNEVSGSVFFFFRNQDFIGTRIADQTFTRPQFRNNIYGFRIGGPILKDKLFFFAAFESERRVEPGTLFTAALTGQQASATNNISNATAADLEQISSFLQSRYGYDPGPYQGYNRNNVNDKINVRIDWNINQNHKLSFYYNFLRSYADIPPSGSGAPPGGRTANIDGMPFFNNWYRINNNLNSFIVELNSTLSPKIANKLQVGYTAFRDFRNSVLGTETPFYNTTGTAIPNFPLVDIRNPAAGGRYYTSFGYEPFSAGNILNTNVFQISDDVTYFAGDHTITAGTYNEFYQFENGFAPQFNGQYIFNSTAQFLAAATAGTTIFRGGFVSGTPVGAPNSLTNFDGTIFQLRYSNIPGNDFPLARISAAQLGFYLQDEWTVKPNLKVTGGLRVDIPIIASSINQNPDLIDPNQNGSGPRVFRDGESIDVTKVQNTALLWSPRIGFNWDVFKDKKTQIRGGTGIFTGRVPFVWISNQASNTGMLFGVENFGLNATTGGASSITSLTQGLPGFTGSVEAYRQSIYARTGYGQRPVGNYNIAYTDPNFKYPQTWRTNIGWDQKLPYGFSTTVEVMYTRFLNAVYHQNVNLPNALATAAGADPRPLFRDPVAPGNQFVSNNATTRINQNITDAIKMSNTSLGYATSLTGTVRYRNYGVDASLSYTYTDSRTVNDGGSIAQSIWRDRQVSGDPNVNVLGFSNFWTPHRIVGNVNYRIEYAKNFASTFGIVYVGSPSGTLTYTYNSDLNGDGQFNDLMYVPNGPNDILLRDQVFNFPAVVINGNPFPAQTVTYTAAQQWADLDAYINQDEYLRTRRGTVVDRNGGIRPWLHRFDVRFLQDFYLIVNKKRHTLQLSVDILNFGNMLNPNWGIEQFPNRTSPLSLAPNAAGVVSNGFLIAPTVNTVSGSTAAVGTPAFVFNYLSNPVRAADGSITTGLPLSSTYRNDALVTSGSTWQLQIGVRYIFN